MHPDEIYTLWQKRKMDTKTAKEELRHGRSKTARRLIESIDYLEAQGLIARGRHVMEVRAAEISRAQSPFIPHPLIDQFMAQFAEDRVQKSTRFKSLMMKGFSNSGKTQKAMSLFGASRTLVVNCQTISPHLPSLREYDQSVHSAILFDEIDQDQVLHNKVVFQSPNVPVKLGQSACNQHMYELWIHGTPLILCSNTFSFTHTVSGKKIPHVDRGWSQDNLITVELGEGEKWFLEPQRPAEEAASIQDGLDMLGHGFG